MLSLNHYYCWVDVWAFERLLTEAEKNNNAPIDNKLLRLYHGPFLCEEEAAWALPLRERLSSRFVRCLRVRGRLLEQAEKYEEAITLYQKGIEAGPVS